MPFRLAMAQRATLSAGDVALTSRTAEACHFFRAWLAEPLRVAAVAPSGRALSALMLSEISPAAGPIIELGPGTGAFTRAMVAKGVAQEKLVLIEYGADFVAKLSVDFPRAKTLRMDATRLRNVALFDGAPAGAVISGLPLLSMTVRQIFAILDGAFAHLHGDGVFYQFTYGLRCSVPRPVLDRLGLKATFVGHTFANLPPASVYRICRRRSRHPHRFVEGTEA